MDIAGWEGLYRAGDRGNEDKPSSLLVDTIAGRQPGTALDLACGAGRNALFLAEKGWTVTAVDGASTALALLEQRSIARHLQIHTELADLTAPAFDLSPDMFDLVVIAYYLQRDLFAKAKRSVRTGGLVLAIAHIPDPGETWTAKRASPGELAGFFDDWKILHSYEGASRDPAHHRPVAEIVAQRPA